MGLDMYLMRYPRYKGYGPDDIDRVDNYLDYLEDEEAKKKYTVGEWCGIREDQLPCVDDIDHLKKYRVERYSAWDEEKRHPHMRISDNVAYWRKANAIHRWFVDNIQKGVDDCEYHREVRKEDLEELQEICKKVIEGSVLIKGKVENGTKYKNGKWVKIYENGLKVLNPELCNELLPSADGFFFGSMDYDQWYVEDVKYTYDVLSQVLKETDFDKQMIYYTSSW